jgi:hypothetical protein
LGWLGIHHRNGETALIGITRGIPRGALHQGGAERELAA